MKRRYGNRQELVEEKSSRERRMSVGVKIPKMYHGKPMKLPNIHFFLKG